MNRLQQITYLLFALCFLVILWTWSIYMPNEKIRCNTPECWKQYEALKARMAKEKETFVSPLFNVKGIMLGGVQRSGVNLLRTLLNAHPQLDCSHEISLSKWKDQDTTDPTVLYDIAKSVGEEISDVKDDELLCIKADFDYMQVLTWVLPNVKTIVVIRDGRAVAHSLVAHGNVIEDFDTALNYWSKSLSTMLDHCYTLQSEMCMIMIYEKLVVDTEVWIKAALNFAGLPWHPNVLNHTRITKDDYYKKLGTINGRLKEPIHSNAIDEWRVALTEEELQRVFAMAPLLRKLGYPL